MYYIYIYMYVCMHACMDGWMDGWMHVYTYVRTYVRTYVCYVFMLCYVMLCYVMLVCMYVCMYVRTYVSMYVRTFIRVRTYVCIWISSSPSNNAIIIPYMRGMNGASIPAWTHLCWWIAVAPAWIPDPLSELSHLPYFSVLWCAWARIRPNLWNSGSTKQWHNLRSIWGQDPSGPKLQPRPHSKRSNVASLAWPACRGCHPGDPG